MIWDKKIPTSISGQDAIDARTHQSVTLSSYINTTQHIHNYVGLWYIEICNRKIVDVNMHKIYRVAICTTDSSE